MPFVVYSKTAAAASIFIHKNFVESRSPRVCVSPISCALAGLFLPHVSPPSPHAKDAWNKSRDSPPLPPPPLPLRPLARPSELPFSAPLSDLLFSLFPLVRGEGGRADKSGSLLPLLSFSLRTKGWLASGLRPRERAIGRPPQGRKERVLFPLCEDRRLRRRPVEGGS